VQIFESISQITVLKMEWVDKVDEFAVFPILYLRKFRK